MTRSKTQITLYSKTLFLTFLVLYHNDNHCHLKECIDKLLQYLNFRYYYNITTYKHHIHIMLSSTEESRVLIC